MYENERDAELAINELNIIIGNINFLVESMEDFNDSLTKIKTIQRKRDSIKSRLDHAKELIIAKHDEIVDAYGRFKSDKAGDPHKFQSVIEQLEEATKLQEKADKLQVELDYLNDVYYKIQAKYDDFSPARYEHMQALYRDCVARYNSQLLRVLYYVKPPEGIICSVNTSLFKSERIVKAETPATTQSIIEKLDMLNIQELSANTETEENEN